MYSVFGDVEWCFNASWGFKGLKLIATHLEVMAPYRDTHIQAGEKYLCFQTFYKSECLNTHLVPNNFDLISFKAAPWEWDENF